LKARRSHRTEATAPLNQNRGFYRATGQTKVRSDVREISEVRLRKIQRCQLCYARLGEDVADLRARLPSVVARPDPVEDTPRVCGV
jgi:hypothetical protein